MKLRGHTPRRHSPGRVRAFVEKTGGVVAAITKVPANFVSGILVGSVQGGRKGLDPKSAPKPSSTALAQLTLNALQNSVIAAVTGMAVGGPIAAAVNVATDAANSAGGIAVAVKTGSAKEIGREMAQAIDRRVGPGSGLVGGVFKGAVAGSTSGVTGAVKTGFSEGRGTVAGVLDGLKETFREFARAHKPRKNILKASLGVALGVARAVVCAPAGAALSLLVGPTQERKELGSGARLAISGASGAVSGAALGLLGGPLGALIGAGVGSLLSLSGPSRKASFLKKTRRSIRRAQRGNADLGSEVANNNRNLFQGIIVGGLSGAHQGWNSANGLGEGKPPR